jgi:hypothetical protein
MACDKQTVLSAVTQAFALKTKHQMSQAAFDDMMDLWKSTLPSNDEMPKNFYEAKRLVDGLGMEHQKIDVCPNFCMLYYKKRTSSK